jgi:TctA family transporter
MFDGNPIFFFSRPISAVIMALAIGLLLYPLIPGLRARPAVSEE